ncbi:MAG: serine hydrolase domain-containing protein [Myxococcaceae bacterium]
MKHGGWVVMVLVGACSGTPARDGGVTDAGIDGGHDAGLPDAGEDAGFDAGADAGVDAGLDAGLPMACVQRQAALQAALDAALNSQAASAATASLDCPTLTVSSGPLSDAGTLYRIGSVTKTYVSATVITLEHEGALSLDDTLDKWSLPVPDAGAITVRQLLNHTAGLFNYTDDPAVQNAQTISMPVTPEQMVAIAAQHPPYFAPGAGWHYSNTDYVLLGMIVKEATDGGLADAISQRAFGPAHLSHTFLDGEQALDGGLVPGFDQSTDVTHLMDPSWAWAAGAMVAAPSDVADWVFRLYRGEVLPDGGTAELTANAIDTGQGVQYGLGVAILPAAATGGRGVAIGHDGAIPGFQAFAFYFPQKQASLVVTIDSDSADINAVYAALMQALFP